MTEQPPKTFEEAMKELEAIVQKLEQGSISLDESIEMFQKGISLSRYCNNLLDDMEKKVVKLVEVQGEMQEKEIKDEFSE